MNDEREREKNKKEKRERTPTNEIKKKFKNVFFFFLNITPSKAVMSLESRVLQRMKVNEKAENRQD